jgi:hypothetical protein
MASIEVSGRVEIAIGMYCPLSATLIPNASREVIKGELYHNHT